MLPGAMNSVKLGSLLPYTGSPQMMGREAASSVNRHSLGKGLFSLAFPAKFYSEVSIHNGQAHILSPCSKIIFLPLFASCNIQIFIPHALFLTLLLPLFCIYFARFIEFPPYVSSSFLFSSPCSYFFPKMTSPVIFPPHTGLDRGVFP